MHIIKDPVHKDIIVSELETMLVDSPAVQRLRNIKQLGPTHLVYPSAMHSRFEHSLGTMHLAGQVADALKIKENEKQELKIAGLLHDIGHFPYSHIHRIENMLKQQTKKDHADISTDKIIEEYGELLEKNNIDSKNIAMLVKGKGKYGQILSSGIDIDKMDYLMRDAYFTGTAYGLIDLSRLFSTTVFKDSTFGFLKKGLKNIESVVLSRHLMFSAVYYHETVEIAMTMLGRSIQNLCDSGALKIESLKTMDDIDLISLIRKEKEKIGLLADKRMLYKTINSINYKELDKNTQKQCVTLNENPNELKILEKTIAKELKLNSDDFLVHIRPTPKSIENTKIFDNNRFFDLETLSPLTKTLKEEQINEWKLLLLSKKENMASGKQAKKVFLENI